MNYYVYVRNKESEVRKKMTLVELTETTEAEKRRLLRTIRELNSKRKKEGLKPIEYKLKELLITETIRSR